MLLRVASTYIHKQQNACVDGKHKSTHKKKIKCNNSRKNGSLESFFHNNITEHNGEPGNVMCVVFEL